MIAALEQLKSEGVRVEETDLAHLSPARYEYINPYGKYQFKIDEILSRDRLRPLRRSQFAQLLAQPLTAQICIRIATKFYTNTFSTIITFIHIEIPSYPNLRYCPSFSVTNYR